MDIEFDAQKDEANRAKHGIDLAFGARIFEDPDHLILPTIREADEEERYKAIGMIDGKVHTAVHVWRDATVRLISVRRSNGHEERAYHSD